MTGGGAAGWTELVPTRLWVPATQLGWAVCSLLLAAAVHPPLRCPLLCGQVLGRGERLELLVEKTDTLGQQAFAFKRQARGGGGCAALRRLGRAWGERPASAPAGQPCARRLPIPVCHQRSPLSPRLVPTPPRHAGACDAATDVVAERAHDGAGGGPGPAGCLHPGGCGGALPVVVGAVRRGGCGEPHAAAWLSSSVAHGRIPVAD